MLRRLVLPKHTPNNRDEQECFEGRTDGPPASAVSQSVSQSVCKQSFFFLSPATLEMLYRQRMSRMMAFFFCPLILELGTLSTHVLFVFDSPSCLSFLCSQLPSGTLELLINDTSFPGYKAAPLPIWIWTSLRVRLRGHRRLEQVPTSRLVILMRKPSHGCRSRCRPNDSSWRTALLADSLSWLWAVFAARLCRFVRCSCCLLLVGWVTRIC